MFNNTTNSHQGSFKLGGLINGSYLKAHVAKSEARARWSEMRAGLERQRQELLLSNCIKRELVNSLYTEFSL